MQRSYFFLLDKLKITAAERKLMITLITVLTLLGLLHMSLPKQQSADSSNADYARIQQTFEQRSLQVHQDSVDKMARYLPGRNTQRQQQKVDDGSKIESEEETAAYAAVANNGSRVTEKSKTKLAEEKKPQKININSADREALQMLPGIGLAYSKRIITYRQENGPFKTLEELKNVKGIGPKTLEDILPLLDTTIFHKN